jgi:hypothetical protein
MTTRAVATLLVVLIAAAARAEGPPEPEIGYTFPAGGRAGQAVAVRLGIDEWTPDLQYFVYADGVSLTIDGAPGPLLLQDRPHPFGKKAYNPPPLPREVPARFVIPANTAAGPIRWQVANANGISHTGIFIVSRDRELMENEERDGPQSVGDLPVIVNGRVRKNEEVDRYTVRRKTAGPITCDLSARRLGSKFHGVIEVRDSRGIRIADAVDTRGLDAACTFFAEAGVDYCVCVHDLDFLGHRGFVYRLAVSAAPRVIAAIPTAHRNGKLTPVEFLGFGIKTGAGRLERITRAVELSSNSNQASIDYQLRTPYGASAGVPIDVPREVRSAGTLRAIPVAVTAEFDPKHRVHRYSFFAKKKDRFAARAASRVVGEPVDVSLTLSGPDGKEIGRNDDLTGTADAGLDFVAPAEGPYEAVVSDLSEFGALPHVYHFAVHRETPDFAIESPLRLSALIGEKTELLLKVRRSGGFAEPIHVTIDGLPEGLHAPRDSKDLTIPAGQDEGKIPLTSDRNAPATAAVAGIRGTAKIGGRDVTHAATAQTNDNLASTSENTIPRFVAASIMKPRVRIWPVESDERTVNRGTVHLAELGIERLEGFDGEVMFQMESRQPNKFRQGVTGPDVVIPAGQTRVLYPCFIGEESETVDAYRVSVNALARVRDSRGVEHWLMSCMQSTVSVALTVEGGLMKVTSEIERLQCRPGQTVTIPVRLLRSPRLTEPATIRVLLPEHHGSTITAAPIRVPPGRETAKLVLKIAETPVVSGPQKLTLQAIATQPANVPRLAEGLHATPLDADTLELLARGESPIISETTLTIDVLGGGPTQTTNRAPLAP